MKMSKDLHRVPKYHPNHSQIITTSDTVSSISSHIKSINNNLHNFRWVLLSLFFGFAVSLIVSYRNSIFYFWGLFIGIFISIFVFHIYKKEKRRRNEQIKGLKKERALVIQQVYFLGGITKESLRDYNQRGVLTDSFYHYLLSIPDEVVKRNIIQRFKVVYIDNTEEILENAFYDLFRQVLVIYDRELNIIRIIPLEGKIKSIFPI